MSVASACPVAVSQRMAVSSQDAVASSVPSEENAQAMTQWVWPSRRARSRPVATSHSSAVWSWEAVASRVPSGENAQPYRPLDGASMVRRSAGSGWSGSGQRLSSRGMARCGR